MASCCGQRLTEKDRMGSRLVCGKCGKMQGSGASAPPMSSNTGTGNAPKQRHGCLTTWLILMLLANSGTALMYLLGDSSIHTILPDMAGWVIPVLIVMCLFNIVCTIALFMWKKWGFWGFIVSSVVSVGVNISGGLDIGSSAGGLIGIAILYGIMQIGDKNKNKGWPQME